MNMTANAPDEESIRNALMDVVDPEVGMNVVELGLVYGVEVTPERIRVQMTMTSQACPMGDMIVESARNAIRGAAPGMEDIEVELVWAPPWTPNRMSESARDRFGWPGS